MKAFITGITGQDGSYLAEFLLDRGYEVHGIIRRSSSFNTGRIDHIFDRLHLYHGDLTDGGALGEVIRMVRPDEIYNLAAQSHVKTSFEIPEYTGNADGLGTLRMLEAARSVDAKFYQASSSEMFGNAKAPQDEKTPFHPRSPYGAAKLYAHALTVNYRESYGLFACNGILFNHESPRRGETFVTRKITKAAARIALGKQDKLVLGNLDAKRDWGYAPEYVEGMWMMLQQPNPDDYVLATKCTWSIRDFLDVAFKTMGLRWERYVEIDPKYHRPAEIDILRGNPDKAEERLGWKAKTLMPELAKIMVDADYELNK